MCHFGSLSGIQKFNFRIKILPKNLFYKILCLLFQQGKLSITTNISSKNGQWPIPCCKSQLIMKYCSKFLASSICQNIFIAYAKTFTIVDILVRFPSERYN